MGRGLRAAVFLGVLLWTLPPARVPFAAPGDAGSPTPSEAARKKAEELGSKPIDIAADRLLADSGAESVTFEGNVVARQEDVTLYADRVHAEYSRPARAIEKITAEGNVRILYTGREARAPRAVFHNLEQRVELSGGAELTYGENTLKGDTMTLFLRDNRSVVTGGDGGRVRAVIHPKGLPGIPGLPGAPPR